MKCNAKSFPILLLLMMFFLFYDTGCRSRDQKIISKREFIEIYARLLIIDEMELSPEYKQLLRTELFKQYKKSRSDIERTIDYYNTRPEDWIDLLRRIRDRIEELRTAKLNQKIR
jgi:hypothetical protein